MFEANAFKNTNEINTYKLFSFGGKSYNDQQLKEQIEKNQKWVYEQLKFMSAQLEKMTEAICSQDNTLLKEYRICENLHKKINEHNPLVAKRKALLFRALLKEENGGIFLECSHIPSTSETFDDAKKSFHRLFAFYFDEKFLPALRGNYINQFSSFSKDINASNILKAAFKKLSQQKFIEIITNDKEESEVLKNSFLSFAEFFT